MINYDIYFKFRFHLFCLGSPLSLHHTFKAPSPLLPLAPESPLHHCLSWSCHRRRPPLPSAACSLETPRMGSSHLPLVLELLTVRLGKPQHRLGHTPMRSWGTVTTGPWWTSPCPVHRVVDLDHANFRKKLNLSKQNLGYFTERPSSFMKINSRCLIS
jgi:hypothetical protein